MLDGGPHLTCEEALTALIGGTRVLLHSYPHTKDITADHRLVKKLLGNVSLNYVLDGHSAQLYSNSVEQVLVIEHYH